MCFYLSIFPSLPHSVAQNSLFSASSRESCRLCIRSRNWKSDQGPTKGSRAIDGWIDGMLFEMVSPSLQHCTLLLSDARIFYVCLMLMKSIDYEGPHYICPLICYVLSLSIKYSFQSVLPDFLHALQPLFPLDSWVGNMDGVELVAIRCSSSDCRYVRAYRTHLHWVYPYLAYLPWVLISWMFILSYKNSVIKGLNYYVVFYLIDPSSFRQ
jgi:hypothetical protein